MKVEKNVPIPTRYPFDKMDVGDSFIVSPEIARSTVTVAAGRYGEKHNMKFTVRKYKDGAYRCWRIE
jgi:hypothetical protein